MNVPHYIRRYEDLGFGLFLHWGLYSQLEDGEWTWFHNRRRYDEYVALFNRFDAKGFDAEALARWAKSIGLRYLCLTTRHHEGFSLYDTRGLNTFDAPHSPAKRDLVREFSDACDRHGLGKFFYHTTLDWWHPDFDGNWDAYQKYLRNSIEILCTHYGKVDGLWFDGNWARRERDWQEDALYGLIRRLQAECIIVNNSSLGAHGAVGHPMTDVRTFEQGAVAAQADTSGGRYRALEVCDTFGTHWGTAHMDLGLKGPGAIIERLAACRRHRANYLFNVGPCPDGSLPAYEKAALDLVGRWAAPLSQALSTAQPAKVVCTGKDFVLFEGKNAWYFAHDLPTATNHHCMQVKPRHGLLTVEGPLQKLERITWTDNGESLDFTQGPGQLVFNATQFPYGKNTVVRVAHLQFA